MIAAWLDNGGQVDATRPVAYPNGDVVHGTTLLMEASSAGRVMLVDLLLECRASVDLQDSQGVTALMGAANGQHLSIVLRLQQAGAAGASREA